MRRGMGSSAIGASLLIKHLEEAAISIPVDYNSIYQLKDGEDLFSYYPIRGLVL